MNATGRVVAAWRSLDRRPADIVLTGALLALMIGELAAKPPEPGESATTPVAYLWALLITLPVLVHRRYPVPALLAAAAGIVGYAAGHFTAFPGYAAFAMVFVVSLHCGRGRGLLAFGVLTATVGVALSMQGTPTVMLSTYIVSALALTIAWLAGDNLRVRQQRWESLKARAERLEADREERARQAVIEERLRIARELHDVVAHSMSVIAVQAGVANHVIDSRPDLARQALATVETNTRAALVEMRRLLGVLRHAGEPSASLTPAPGLADVPGLVRQFADVGLAVDVTVTGAPDAVPDGVDLSAYRIVQEGLTNVLRHGGPRATVVIGYEPGLVRIGVGDEGSGRRAPSPAGHGLIGMRERVAVFGGTLSAGPRPGGGWDLRATLPYADAPVGVAA
jgi:signal transduction histidine kinase